jgi:hypothetical protein
MLSRGVALGDLLALEGGEGRHLRRAATVSTAARAAFAGGVEGGARTVITFLASLDCTVWSALPA